MLNTSNCEEYLAEVRTFADKVGKREQLEGRLKYLAEYAKQGENETTECLLFRDHAPFSFYFKMWRIDRPVTLYKLECEKCGETYESECKHDTCPDWPEGQDRSCGGKLCVVGMKFTRAKDGFWFDGGLIFHGAHDNGGDGGMPTLSVRLEPTDGWSIHT